MGYIKENSNKLNMTFALIVMVQILLIVYVQSLRPDIFMDEYWSFNFANSNYRPLLGDGSYLYNKWISKDLWQQLLTVQPGETFNYGSVAYNTAKDVHPPLYYFVLHTVCSLFPNSFSVWYGIFVNVVFFVGVQFLLLKMGTLYFNNDADKLLPIIIYGFSIGCLQNAVFIRMYMMLTFLCTLSIYFHLKLLSQGKLKNFLLVGLVHIVGFLTQYYYLIFAAAEFIVIAFVYYRKKDLSKLGRYFVFDCIALGISVLLFPACLNHILGIGSNGYRGAEIINGLSKLIFFDKLAIFSAQMLLSEGALCFMLLSIALVFLYGFSKNIDGKVISVFKDIKKEIIVIFTVLVLTYLLIVKISVMLFIRYMFMLFPLFVLSTYYIFSLVLYNNFNVRKSTIYLFLIGITAVQLAFVKKIDTGDWLYIGNRNLPHISSEWIKKENIKQSIVVLNDQEYGAVIYHLGILSNVDKTFIVESKRIGQLSKLELDDKVIAIVLKDKCIDLNSTISFFEDKLALKKYSILAGMADYEVLLKK